MGANRNYFYGSSGGRGAERGGCRNGAIMRALTTRVAASLLVLALAAGCARPTTPEATARRQRSARCRPRGRTDSTPPLRRASTGWSSPTRRSPRSVGLDVLRAGGNAVDAAVATAFALAVVYPDGRQRRRRRLRRRAHERARPSRSTSARRRPPPRRATCTSTPHGKPTETSVTGTSSVGVPGSVAGLWELHQKLGSEEDLGRARCARDRARRGGLRRRRATSRATLDGRGERLARFPASAALFLPGGAPLAQGATLEEPRARRACCAASRERGPTGFYKGETADLIVAEMKRGGGIITREDLAAYEAKWRTPIEFTYRGHRVASMPPPSSGGVTLAMIAHILEGYDLRASAGIAARTLHLRPRRCGARSPPQREARRSRLREDRARPTLSSKACARRAAAHRSPGARDAVVRDLGRPGSERRRAAHHALLRRRRATATRSRSRRRSTRGSARPSR